MAYSTYRSAAFSFFLARPKNEAQHDATCRENGQSCNQIPKLHVTFAWKRGGDFLFLLQGLKLGKGGWGRFLQDSAFVHLFQSLHVQKHIILNTFQFPCSRLHHTHKIPFGNEACACITAPSGEPTQSLTLVMTVSKINTERSLPVP